MNKKSTIILEWKQIHNKLQIHMIADKCLQASQIQKSNMIVTYKMSNAASFLP